MKKTYYMNAVILGIEQKTLRKGSTSPGGYVIFFIIFIFMDSKIKHVCIEFNESENKRNFTTVCYGICCLSH